MKKINLISNHIILGILFVFLLGSINSRVYGWSNNAGAATQLDTIHQSLTQGGLTQFNKLDSVNKYGQFFIEIEVEEEVEEQVGEQVGEENFETLASVLSEIYYSSDNMILPSSFKYISNLSHAKKYLLFHQLKINC